MFVVGGDLKLIREIPVQSRDVMFSPKLFIVSQPYTVGRIVAFSTVTVISGGSSSLKYSIQDWTQDSCSGTFGGMLHKAGC